MRRPGNLRGIGRLGHYNLGIVSFNPINRADPFGPGNTMPTTAYATPQGYSINPPPSAPVILAPAPPVVNITGPATITPSAPPTPYVTPVTATIPTPSPVSPVIIPTPIVPSSPVASPSGSSSTTSSNSSTSSSSSTSQTLPGITTSYTVPIPGIDYAYPGMSTMPGITTSVSSASSVNADYPTTAQTVNYPFWSKPKVKWLAVVVILALAFRKN